VIGSHGIGDDAGGNEDAGPYHIAGNQHHRAEQTYLSLQLLLRHSDYP
jgi:hypothetical protein